MIINTNNHLHSTSIKISLSLTLLLSVSLAMAQPSAVRKAAKSVFKLTTFRADGSLIATTSGVFVGPEGCGISQWSPFVGASSAEIKDASGKTYHVESISGVNEIYDVVKIKINAKTPSVSLASEAVSGQQLWVTGYAETKPNIKGIKVTSVESFGGGTHRESGNDEHLQNGGTDKSYKFYLLEGDVTETTNCCPLFNDGGQLVALMLLSQASGRPQGVDAHFADSFQPTGLTANSLSSTHIRATLPSTLADARLALMLMSQKEDSLAYAATISDFINQFPSETDGYMARARQQVDANLFDLARTTCETAIEKVENKDEAHFAYARIIYMKEFNKVEHPYAPWNLDMAYEEAAKAYGLNPLPAYEHLQGQIRYSQHRWDEAYRIFMKLTKGPLYGSELFYEAAACKEMMNNATQEEVLALLDSAVNASPHPLGPVAAPYVLARAQHLGRMGLHRRAIADYLAWDTLTTTFPTAEMLYEREQTELHAKLYEPALAHITLAIAIDGSEPLYQAERAALLLRVGKAEEALKAAEACLSVDAENSDAHVVKGIALIKTGRKGEGLAALRKAKELGNSQAELFVKKYE